MKNLNIRILFLFICLPFLACSQTPKKFDIPRPKQDILQYNLSAPEAHGVVNDFEDLFTKNQKAELDSLINDFKKRTTIQIAIATLDEYQCDKADFDAYSLQLANAWGVGIKGKDNGVFIAISKQFRQMRIQNGKGIEKVFTNEQTKQIIDQYFIPKFKEDNYFEGTKNGLQQLIKELEKAK
ncbi:MAG: TPM domain-containing protein [Chitinophagaceae bacterium]|nr:MAG: TPM domain-containing protein [Chitinophagaceae bacterium]